MENGWKNMEDGHKKWSFICNEKIETSSERSMSAGGALDRIMQNINTGNERSSIFLHHGDLAAGQCFQTSRVAEETVLNVVRTARYNCYAPCVGTVSARRSIAEYLSKDLPYQLSFDDVYMTMGCTQAIEVILTVLSRPGANILLPKPGFPHYEARCAFSRLEVRHFNLLPENGWEVDLDTVEAHADENTVAMVLINPGNPCGSVFSSNHLEKIAETARKLRILVIADEVYSRLVFGTNPFVPMAAFGSIAPVITLGSISKSWAVPGWRLGWLAICDPNGILQRSEINEFIDCCLHIIPEPPTIMLGAIPKILEETEGEFFLRINDTLRQYSQICYEKIKDIPCLNCPYKSKGSMFMMVSLNLSSLEGITDDIDFCLKLAEEESVILVPGIVVGLKNWVRLSFALEQHTLEEGLGRIKSFCERHAKQQ